MNDELETREARAAKLEAICEDLQLLNEKLVGTIKAEVKKEKEKDDGAQAQEDESMAAAVEPAPEEPAGAAPAASGGVPPDCNSDRVFLTFLVFVVDGHSCELRQPNRRRRGGPRLGRGR